MKIFDYIITSLTPTYWYNDYTIAISGCNLV